MALFIAAALSLCDEIQSDISLSVSYASGAPLTIAATASETFLSTDPSPLPVSVSTAVCRLSTSDSSPSTAVCKPSTVVVSGLIHSIVPSLFLRGCAPVSAASKPTRETVPSTMEMLFPSPNTALPAALSVLSGWITYSVATPLSTTTSVWP